MENVLSRQNTISERRAFHWPVREYMSVMQTACLRDQKFLHFSFLASMVSFLFLGSVAIESVVCNGLIGAVVHRQHTLGRLNPLWEMQHNVANNARSTVLVVSFIFYCIFWELIDLWLDVAPQDMLKTKQVIRKMPQKATMHSCGLSYPENISCGW